MELAKNIIDISEKVSAEQTAEDYVGQDGLLYCGKCRTRKQTVNTKGGFLRGMKVNCLCSCEAKRKAGEREQEERQRFQERIKRLRRDSFPDEDLAGMTFAKSGKVNSQLMTALKNYVLNFDEMKKEGMGLLLYGDVGTGKTHGAACVVNALTDRGVPCLMTSFSRILNTLWNAEDKQKYLDSFNLFDLLVLDDLGTERRTEYAQDQVFAVVDARYRAHLPLIITTNMDVKQMMTGTNLNDKRIYDRIISMCQPLKMSGNSRRQSAFREQYDKIRSILGIG